MRKLASIRKILDINPIPNADNIEVVTIDGWKVVTKKGEFHIGDLCVYCEIDSFLPIKPEFEFLRNSSYKKLNDGTEGFRLKTIKLKGQISQGLCLPTSILSSVYSEGDDVTDLLNIKLFEPELPAQLSGRILGLFPSFIPKTDEERIQNYKKYLKKFTKFYITEKIDGTSLTIYHRDGVLGVCSRNLELDLTYKNNSYINTCTRYDLFNKLKHYSKNIALQGELVGPGIQKNRYKLNNTEIYFFTAYNIDKGEYFDFETFKTLLKEFNLKSVPILSEEFIYNDQDLLSMADGNSILNANLKREGLVFRSVSLPKISFKSISNKFLLSSEK